MSFQTALTGLSAAQGNLSVTSNNIANSSTTGFKQSRAEFADIYATSVYGASTNAIGSGVKMADVAQQFTQGNIDFTDNPLDLAISGEGFFRLDQNGAISYSRAGMFKVDKDGYIVNSTGQSLTGYQATPTGTITGALDRLQVDTAAQAPSATGDLTTGGGINAILNVDAGAALTPALPAFNRLDPSTYTSTTSMTTYDTLGNSMLTSLYLVRRAVGGAAPAAAVSEWDVHMWVTATDSAGTSTEIEVLPQDGSPAAGEPAKLYFDANGQLLAAPDGIEPEVAANPTAIDYDPTAAPGVGYIVYDPVTGLATANSLADISGGNFGNFDLDMAGTTQYGSPFGVTTLTQDGYSTGQLTSVDISEGGTVFARYNNGQSRSLGQVALARFQNPQGLQPNGDTMWTETFDSGQPLVGAPGSSTLGLVQSGALEASNVDISKQLVNMIVAQRDFQANAKMISTQDQITQSIINIR